MGLRSMLAKLVGAGDQGDHAVATAQAPADGSATTIDENGLLIQAFDEVVEAGLMLDVGAHYGTTSLPFLSRGWRVIGFEPDKAKHARLKAIAAEEPRFELLACAVGERRQEGVQFYTSDESSGIASLVPFRDSHTEGAQVRVRPLDEVLSERSIEHVDYLKVDAEGYDLRVLQGFPFDRIKPTAILCEFEDEKTRRIGYSTDDLGEYLCAQGYTVFMSEWHPIVRYGITHTWRSLRQYPCSLTDPNGWGNFIAVRPGPFEEALRRAASRWM
ncbi:MAG: FkbM family methyltransferase [Planctomycetota bacterium]